MIWGAAISVIGFFVFGAGSGVSPPPQPADPAWRSLWREFGDWDPAENHCWMSVKRLGAMLFVLGFALAFWFA